MKTGCDLHRAGRNIFWSWKFVSKASTCTSSTKSDAAWFKSRRH